MDNNRNELSDNTSQINNNSQQSSVPSVPTTSLPKSNFIKPKILVIIVISFLVLAGILYAGYQYINSQKTRVNQSTNNTANPQITGEQSPTGTTIQTGNVEWLSEPQKVQSVGFFTLIDQYYPYKLEYCKSGTDCSKLSEMSDKYEPKTTYYKVGTMKSQYAGSPVFLAITKGLPTTHVFKGIGTEKDIVYDAEMLSIFIKTQDNKFVVTNDYQNGLILCRGGCNQNQLPPSNELAGITYNHNLSLDKVGTGYEYTEPSTGIKFQINRTNHFFNQSGLYLYLVKDFGEGYALYSNQDINNNPIRLKTVINPTFVVKLPTGLVADVYSGSYSNRLLYQKGSSGYEPSESSPLNWTATEKPKLLPKEPSDKGIVTDYTAIAYTSDYDGCRGNMTLDNSASDAETLDVSNNLTQVATTDKGDVLYDVKNKDFKIYQQFWFWKVTSNGLDSVLTYNDYLALKPILIWKNKLGVYRMVFREDLVSSKCWGEPLIYLYPQNKTEVQVKLDKVISLTESEPRYDNGWNVIAFPDGKIYSKNKNRYYPYLYWEGSAPLGSTPVIQDSVKHGDIHTYFEDMLPKLGLNDKEIVDFEQYWEPQLTGSPYYLISFYDAEELNKIAPFHITPAPNTVIRVLMTYEKINQPVDTKDVDYQTPVRNGFTVVEWGGILHSIKP